VLWRAGEVENVGVVQGEFWWLSEADLCLSNLQLCPPRSDGCSSCEPISFADSVSACFSISMSISVSPVKRFYQSNFTLMADKT
jgi:hypothetical protein